MIGQIYESNNFGKFKIIDYTNRSNVIIEFLNTGFNKKTTMQRVEKGDIKDDLVPSIEGIGFNDGKYSKYYTGGRSIYYYRWVNMLRRVKNTQNKTAYENVSCSQRWLYFSKFLDDIHEIENFDQLDWELDKDILFKGNRTYSKETCCFVPSKINSLFITLNSVRSNKGNQPLGVQFCNRDKIYSSSLSIDGTRKRLGTFKNAEEAFYAYKVAKEENIKRVADEYKDIIADNVYNALYNWQIEITD